MPSYIMGRLEINDIRRADGESLPLGEMLARYEILLIKDAYERNGRSLTKTAKELQVSKQNLAYKMKKYEIK